MPDQQHLAEYEGFEDVLAMIGGKWKLSILRILIFGGKRRFNALRREIGGITQTMLTKQLKALEEDGLVAREAFPEVPVRVEYSATPMAMGLKKSFIDIYDWATTHLIPDRSSSNLSEVSKKDASL